MLTANYHLLYEIDNPNSTNGLFGDEVVISGDTVFATDLNASEANGRQIASRITSVDLITGEPLQEFVNPDFSTGGVVDALDSFGVDFAVFGNHLLVGAPGNDINGVEDSGAAYLFNISTGEKIHTFVNDIPPLSMFPDEGFGNRVALNDQFAVISSKSVQGTRAALVFNIDTGLLFTSIGSPVGPTASEAASSLSLEGDTLLVGFQDLNGQDGRVFTYDLSASAIVEQELTHPEPGGGQADFYGSDLILSSSTAVVRAAQGDANATDNGSVYLVDTVADTALNLVNPNVEGNAFVFGSSVALSPNAEVAAVASGAGTSLAVDRVQIYDGVSGSHLQTIDYPGTLSDARFGAGLDISPDWLVVGASVENKLYVYGSERVQFVDDTQDLPDDDLSDGVAEASNGRTTLRAAIQQANASGVPTRIILPEGHYVLDRSGGESNSALNNDLDITGDVTIVGAGAGLSVINASGLTSGTQSRVFELRQGGHLGLEGVTLTGGTLTGGSGGAIYARSGTSVDLDRVAITGNQTVGFGGGIYLASGTDASIRRSVITGNTANGGSSQGGGVFNVNSASGTSLEIGESIVVGNFADVTPSTDWGISSGSASNIAATITSLGNNLLGTLAGNANLPFAGASDIVSGTPDLVVTSEKDEADTLFDANDLSLREAVIEANASNGTIWLPAWDHQLTRSVGETHNASSNDLDITGDVTIVGAGAGLSVINASGLTSGTQSRVFELRLGGHLGLEGVTLTGGTLTGGSGGAIYARSGTSVDLDRVAITGNQTVGFGGGVYLASSTDASIRRSVITGNTANGGSSQGGGIFNVNRASGTTLEIGESIVVGNFADVISSTDWGISAGSASNIAATITSLGNNLLGTLAGNANLPFTGAGSTDTVGGTPGFVVTSVADRIDSSDDDYALSLREAVIRSNDPAGSPDLLWLPPWLFLLTEENIAGDEDESLSGDLDILGDFFASSAGASTIDATRIVDDAFELLGSPLGPAQFSLDSDITVVN